MLFIWNGLGGRGAHFSSRDECDVDRFGSVSFYSPFFKPVLDYSFCEAMAGTLSVASAAVLQAEVAVVYSGEVGRSAVYSRYNNGPRALPWDTPALAGEDSAYSVSASKRIVCYANRVLGQGNNLEGETILTCMGVQYAILC
jgi:hypothetical protein